MTGKQMCVVGLVLAGAAGALLWLPPFAGFVSSVMAASTWCHALERV